MLSVVKREFNPIHNRTLNSTADHVLDLPRDLLLIIGLVADIAMMPVTEPRPIACQDLGLRSGMKQRSKGYLAHAPRLGIRPSSYVSSARTGVIRAATVQATKSSVVRA